MSAGVMTEMANQHGGKKPVYLKNGALACDLASLPRCQALAPTTGKTCKRPAQKGKTMCGIHLGTYKCGSKPNNRSALKTGFYTREAMQERARARQAIRSVKKLRKTIEGLTP